MLDLKLLRTYKHTGFKRDIVPFHYDAALDIWTFRVIDAAPYGEIKQCSSLGLSGQLVLVDKPAEASSNLLLGEAINIILDSDSKLFYLFDSATVGYYTYDANMGLFHIQNGHASVAKTTGDQWMTTSWSVLSGTPDEHAVA